MCGVSLSKFDSTAPVHPVVWHSSNSCSTLMLYISLDAMGSHRRAWTCMVRGSQCYMHLCCLGANQTNTENCVFVLVSEIDCHPPLLYMHLLRSREDH